MGKLTNPVKAVIYIRVSSEKQVENYSLDYQEKILRKYARTDSVKIKHRESRNKKDNKNPSLKNRIFLRP